jgi:hypothetical protein
VSVSDELAKLAALRDQGVLTEEEFAARKQALLASPADVPAQHAPDKKTGGIAKGCGILVLIVIGLAVLGSLLGGGEKKDASPVAAASKPPIEVTAEQLFRAYQANEAAAQQAYGDSPLLVSGTIAGVDLDIGDNPIVKLRTSNEFMSAQAALADSAKPRAAQLSKGERITLRCESVSEVIGTPMLRDCVIE